MKEKLIPASEVAYILRFRLGPFRAWDDVLSDMRRDRSSYEGLILQPVSVGRINGRYRPVYRLSDVQEFIKHALPLQPSLAAPHKLLIREAEIDPTDIRPWRLRKLPVMF
ncbi:hypothetical protein ACVRTF_004229 [Cronobacter turicensis]